ncbi:hypothetical protein QJS10_CPB14g01339 [Acorus calamus]|uniref:Uncharacterized protein n=1 Tax=Acorus calamus TaxID=4465 RepID=A0AAV9DE87_ACOCL|nr:hypothetical protein QJS10_CPB14g01339 [Acorus calamus]
MTHCGPIGSGPNTSNNTLSGLSLHPPLHLGSGHTSWPAALGIKQRSNVLVFSGDSTNL